MSKTISRVRVRFIATTWVNIDVEHEIGDDPADLTDADYQRALDQTTNYPDWDFNYAEVVEYDLRDD